MNINHVKYTNFLHIKNNWPLDDWSINCECFEKIVEILEFGKTILELGSGKSSELLNKFYKTISIEHNKEWLNKYNTTYIYINTIGKGEYDFKKLEEKIKDIDYDLLLVDGPNDNREEILNYTNFFKANIPIIWDDTQVYEKHAIKMSKILNKEYKTYQCRPQGSFWRNYSGGKRFTLIN